MNYYFLANFIALYISMMGLLNKAGYKAWYGLIPFYNLYLLLKVLDISPIIIFILGLLLIFLPDRMFIGTLIYIFLPFIINDAYNGKFLVGILTLIIPFIMYPVIAFFTGIYSYDKGAC